MKFIKFKIVVYLLLLVHLAKFEDELSLREKIRDSARGCGKELNVDPTQFIPDTKKVSNAPDDPNVTSCMKKCIWEKVGYIDKQGRLNENLLLRDFPEMPGRRIQIAQRCLSLTVRSFKKDCSLFRGYEKCVDSEISKLKE